MWKLWWAGIILNCNLDGLIPPEIGNLTNLNNLSLTFNELSGDIPSEIGNLIGIDTLDLSFNQLSGFIPEEICNVGIPNLNNNKLCPPYPDCISQDDIDSQDTSECP